MAVLRASAYHRARWKNGGGETMEIAVSPIGSSLDTFDWRISMATVASGGPFSVFAGVDRTLCVLSGAGIELRLANEPARHLSGASLPISFSGDLIAHARLTDGAVTDFNVMTRRGRCRPTVDRIRLHAGERRGLDPDVRAVFCQAGVVTIEAAGQCERLEPQDTMLRDVPDGGAWNLFAAAAATVCVVTIVSSS